MNQPPENSSVPPSIEAHRRRGMFFLSLAVAMVGVTMALQQGLNYNFLWGEIHIRPDQLGMLEASREGCGIVAFGVLAILAGLAEPLIGAAMLVLMAIGLGSYAGSHTFTSILMLSLVWSQGLHCWMPLPNSMMLALAEPGRAGLRLGQLSAAGAIGSAVALAIAIGLLFVGVPLRSLYIVAGGSALLGAMACAGVPRQIKTPGPRLVFRRRCRLYFLLCFLDGWRKQIFLTFSNYLLVRTYGTDVKTMLVLWMTVNFISWWAAPKVGRLIDRIGERRVLVLYFSSVICICIGYAFIPNVYALFGLFVLDSCVFLFNTSLTTYVNRIAPPEEHTATLSMGVAMNHVAAVTMPIVGGLAWAYIGYQWTFGIGAMAAALSVLAAMRVPRHVPPPVQTRG